MCLYAFVVITPEVPRLRLQLPAHEVGAHIYSGSEVLVLLVTVAVVACALHAVTVTHLVEVDEMTVLVEESE